MDIGNRIKQARLEAGLSQRQLCGDTITRNMLSLIESGKARPGMDTLAYLAARLGKPMGWFLEEQAVLSPNQQAMANARAAWKQHDAAGALAALESCREDDPVFDPERFLLEALCALTLAELAVDEGRLPYARALLERARLAGEKTPYFTEELEQRRLLAACEAGLETAPASPDRTLFALAKRAFAGGDFDRCGALLESVEHRSAGWFLLRGHCLLKQGQPESAAQLLHQAEAALPDQTAPLLELCYRDLGDFKRAYAYACKQREH